MGMPERAGWLWADYEVAGLSRMDLSIASGKGGDQLGGLGLFRRSG
jgi:hypothetical protein